MQRYAHWQPRGKVAVSPSVMRLQKKPNEGPGDIEARLRKLLANFAPSAKRVSVASIVESLP